MTEMTEKQSASAVMMIRPVRFAWNPQTAESNAFQAQVKKAGEDLVQQAALAEFENLRAVLEAAGIEVIVFDDTPQPHTPDSIFPNNWITTHADGRVVLYPMMAANRRPERRPELIEALSRDYGFYVSETIDLGASEDQQRYLEGTGSMVLDRPGRIAYACLSPRTDAQLLGEFAQRLDYDIVAFDAIDQHGQRIYHTNVMLCIGHDFAVICSASIASDQRPAVLEKLESTGHEIIDISFEQMTSFAGNMLELSARAGGHVLAMSMQALNSLTDRQREALASRASIIAAPIEQIEKNAGGSVRCMLAEIHLPRKEGVQKR